MNRPAGVGKSPPPILPRPGSSSNLSQLATSVAAGGVIPAKSQAAMNPGPPYPPPPISLSSVGNQFDALSSAGNASANGHLGNGGGGVHENGNATGGELPVGKVIQIDGQTYQMIPVTPVPGRPVPSSPAPLLRPKPQGHQQFPGNHPQPLPPAAAAMQHRISPKSQISSLPAASFPSTALRPQQTPKRAIAARPLLPSPSSGRPLAPAIATEPTTARSPAQFSPDGMIASFLDPSSFSDMTTSPIGIGLEESTYPDTLLSPAVSRPHSPVQDPQVKLETLSAPAGTLEAWTNANFVFEGDMAGQLHHDPVTAFEDGTMPCIFFFLFLFFIFPFSPLLTLCCGLICSQERNSAGRGGGRGGREEEEELGSECQVQDQEEDEGAGAGSQGKVDDRAGAQPAAEDPAA